MCVIYESYVSHSTNESEESESCHVMSRPLILHVNVKMSHVAFGHDRNESCHIFGEWFVVQGVAAQGREWGVSHIMNERCHMGIGHVTYWWGMLRGNESCHIWMSYVTYEWVMSHMNESCHIWTSPVTYAYVVPHMNESHPVTRLIHMCHDVSLKLKVSFFKRATNCRALTISHMWISRVTHIMNESSHVWVSYSNRNESCLIYLQVTNMTHVYDLQIYVTWLVPPGHDWSISDMTHFCFTWPACMTARLITGRRRCHKLKVPFRKRATNCRALLWKETFKDNRYDSRVWPADIYRSYGGVSLVSRIDKIIFLFCNRAL